MPVNTEVTPAAGRLRSLVTYLEMTAPPWATRPPSPSLPGIEVRRLAGLAVAEYRRLYRAVGEPWLWWERLVLSDGELAAVLAGPGVELRVLVRNGVFAGYSELDCRAGEVEIAYFGLVPDAIGIGLGRLLLTATLVAAWARRPRLVWLHTCSEDHPGALAFYERVGFRVYRRDEVVIDDPRVSGLLPAEAAPHVPIGG
jgi:ribosomal protein S18 acetylase RimI-like enzyme